MPRLRIDADDLETAISDNEGEWVLDLNTGNVMMAEWIREFGPDGPDGVRDEDDEWDDVELDAERFLPIQPVGSHEAFRWMERFAASQANDRVRGRLLDALEKRHPFRAFKDALLAWPEVRNAWFAYEQTRIRDEAESWLQVQGIDAELVDKHAAGAPPADPKGKG